jgi:hypothetical protein
LKESFVLASVALLSFFIGGNIREYLIKKELVIMTDLIRKSEDFINTSGKLLICGNN